MTQKVLPLKSSYLLSSPDIGHWGGSQDDVSWGSSHHDYSPFYPSYTRFQLSTKDMAPEDEDLTIMERPERIEMDDPDLEP